MLAAGTTPWALFNIPGYGAARGYMCDVDANRLDYKDQCDKRFAQFIRTASKGLNAFQLQRFGLALNHLVKKTKTQCKAYAKKKSPIILDTKSLRARSKAEHACIAVVRTGGRALKQHNRERVKLGLNPIGFRMPGQKTTVKPIPTWSAFLAKASRVVCPGMTFLFTDSLKGTACHTPRVRSWSGDIEINEFNNIRPHQSRVIKHKLVVYSDRTYRSGKKVPAHEVLVMLKTGRVIKAIFDAISGDAIVWGGKKLY